MSTGFNPPSVSGPQRPVRSNRIRNFVLGVSAAALLAGTGIVGIAHAVAPAPSEQVQPQKYGLPDFSSLVERVKPAVVSVQVEIDPSSRTAQNDDDEGQQNPGQAPYQGENPFKGTPFEHFFDQFNNQRRGAPNGGQGGQGGQAQQQRVKAVGSGFFISADGYAVTNNHVVDGASKVEIVTDGGKTHRAKIIGTDPKTDLALIKVEGREDFPFVKMAPTMPKIGEWVLAVGNSYGLGGTVTAGIDRKSVV